jgi:hypothetical protein
MMKNDILLGLFAAVVFSLFIYAIHSLTFPDTRQDYYYYNGQKYILTK